jgi:hypothetical protein
MGQTGKPSYPSAEPSHGLAIRSSSCSQTASLVAIHPPREGLARLGARSVPCLVR